MVEREGATAGSLDRWSWREMKVFLFLVLTGLRCLSVGRG